MSTKVSAPSQLWAQLLPPIVPNPFSQNEMPWQEPTVHAVYLDLGQCGMKMFKGEAELTAKKWCNLCHGRERERQREGWDGWEQWRAAATGVSGVGLNHPQVSLSSWEAGSWPAACSESHASGLGAKLPLQAITADRFCHMCIQLSQSHPKMGKRWLWWPHVVTFSHMYIQAYLEQWAWVETSSTPWCIVYVEVYAK